MERVILNKLMLGAAYYPEHWDRALWEEDITRMQAHGLSVLRIGDFSWSKYEFHEGTFTIGYFDDFLELCVRYGMNVIFCTPTAAPPEWMVCKYPEILNASPDGRPYRGDRRFYNYNSTVYRDFCKRLVKKLAEHYSNWDCIVGWQIDNEVNCDLAEFYSEADNRAFRKYMKKRFGTLDALNDAMGLTFWSRVYDDWDEIRLSKGGVAGACSPHMMLEQKRFFSESALDFCAMQAKIIRKYLPAGKYLTTNGLFANLDYNRLMESGLDFITFDSYPNFAYGAARDPARDTGLMDRKWSWNMTWTRSVSPIYGIMEQQVGATGWSTGHGTVMPKPGRMRLWSMQSIAHGADMVSFFRWRTSPIGVEIYWHGLNDYANTDNRRLHELKAISADVERLQPVAGAVCKAELAILKDYDNEWDANVDGWHGDVERTSGDNWFTALQYSHTPGDFYYLRPDTTVEDLLHYRVLVYPHAALMTPRVSDLLHAYVRAGGTLILGARTGYKDEYGRCPIRPMPGLVSGWCGVTVGEYTLTDSADPKMTVEWQGQTLEVPAFNETLHPDEDTEVLAKFDTNYYAGEPALCRRQVGAGVVYYLGGCFSVEMAKALMAETGVLAPYAGVLELPEAVELVVRADGTAQYLFVLNYSEQAQTLTLHRDLPELTGGKTCLRGSLTLAPFDVNVFCLK